VHVAEKIVGEGFIYKQSIKLEYIVEIVNDFEARK
jgi:hypothetical protein